MRARVRGARRGPRSSRAGPARHQPPQRLADTGLYSDFASRTVDPSNLPPMPWQSIRQLTDGDLKAVYAYLHSIPPISNRVPGLTPPESSVTAEGGGGTAPPPAR